VACLLMRQPFTFHHFPLIFLNTVRQKWHY
jgi:hypothetical protein